MCWQLISLGTGIEIRVQGQKYLVRFWPYLFAIGPAYITFDFWLGILCSCHICLRFRICETNLSLYWDSVPLGVVEKSYEMAYWHRSGSVRLCLTMWDMAWSKITSISGEMRQICMNVMIISQNVNMINCCYPNLYYIASIEFASLRITTIVFKIRVLLYLDKYWKLNHQWLLQLVDLFHLMCLLHALF